MKPWSIQGVVGRDGPDAGEVIENCRDFVKPASSALRAPAQGIRVAGATADEQLALPGIDCHPPSEPTPGLWPNAVALVNVVEDEAGAPNQGDGVTGEMTAIGYTVLERFQSALPCRHARIRSKAMFEEVEPASRTEHPADLRQGGADVGNRAQGEGAEGIVAGVTRERNRLAVEPDEFDRHR